jgi:hypothetical protein
LTILITRPKDHLQQCSESLRELLKETPEQSPDAALLMQAERAICDISTNQLCSLQYSMGRGPDYELEWRDLVSQEKRDSMTDHETKRQV